MKKEVLETIKKYNLIENGDKLVLGVSGGPDSISMLNILKEINDDKNIDLKFEMVVAHINHNIRKEAKEDEEYVKKYCDKNKIKFFVKSIDVEKIANNSKIGLEEAGRKVRYEFFDEVLEKTKFNKIAIAHNKNDKIETIILNILRGSGLLGLKGIEPKRGKYVRPLIEIKRETIEKYCKEENLNPRIDKTNFDNIYNRNKVRNVVIPYIKEEFNPNIVETLNRLSSLVVEEDEYMQIQTKKAYKDILLKEEKKEIVLDLKKFNNYEKVIKSRLVLYTVTKLFNTTKGIEKIHIEDILKLCKNNIGNKFLTPNKNLKILIKDKKIFFLNIK